MKTPEQIGLEARDIAREKIVKKLNECKVTVSKTFKRIAEGLDATETKASYDKDRGKWVYSAPLVDHGKRLEAAQIAVMLHDLKPCAKVKGDIDLGGLIVEVVRFGEDKDTK